MDKKARARQLREEGLTYQQIGKALGCSKQYIAQILGKQDVSKYRYFHNCIYPNISKWMNANKVSLAEFVRRMGHQAISGNLATLRDILTGRVQPRKPYIDLMIKVTGMPYEVLFEVSDSGSQQ
jgi:hypothetical protein